MASLQNAPKPGEFYRHFKGNLYQILSTAVHTETGESLVIYQALYGEFQVFARPLAMFCGVTEDGQERFIKTKPENQPVDSMEFEWKHSDQCQERSHGRKEQLETPEKDKKLYQQMEKFYDADSYEEKLNYLMSMRGHLNDTMLANIAVSLDIVVQDGSLEEQFQSIVSCLKMMKKYQSSRLR